ncbi:MAG TPA: family 43 glycosylhydrolase, partial [bacterium]|nr:family 43 glycosylhydrolase [bacterium]
KGPFEDASAPLIKDASSYIDAHVYFDETSGRHYFYVCRMGNGPGAIWSARLSEDLLSLDTELTMVFSPDQPYDFGWVEAPFIVKHRDTYYMTYSRNGFSSSLYGVCYATAPSPMGPWTKFDRNPILTRTHEVSGPGHNCLVNSPDGRELFIAYHTHLSFAGGGHRQLAIDRLEFVPNGDQPDRLQLANGIPSLNPQPLPSGSVPMRVGRSDDFESSDLDWTRWSIYFHEPGKWRLNDGNLIIETVEGDTHRERSDAANIFLQYAPHKDFRIRTKVNFTPLENHEQAFLMIWQDCNNYIRFSSLYANGQNLEIGCELNGVYDAFLIPNELLPEVFLQIEKKGTRYL